MEDGLEGKPPATAKAEGTVADPGTAAGWKEMVVGEYRRLREHAEMYPYVWGSYILVYGGLTGYLAFRWRKLRRTEDRVRVLQERLRKLAEADQQTAPLQTPVSTQVADKSIGH